MPPVGSETLVRGEMPQATNEVRLNGSRYLEQPTVGSSSIPAIRVKPAFATSSSTKPAETVCAVSASNARNTRTAQHPCSMVGFHDGGDGSSVVGRPRTSMPIRSPMVPRSHRR
ncbi:MAG: hypothetical protein CMJ83_04885 [Planctomycetes bacterium]|nr:hypothetical protein [Planctomycetota bacterium]